MTALEYMEKQLQKHRLNYERESARGVPEEQLHNIEKKISYYESAVNALKKVDEPQFAYPLNCEFEEDLSDGALV